MMIPQSKQGGFHRDSNYLSSRGRLSAPWPAAAGRTMHWSLRYPPTWFPAEPSWRSLHGNAAQRNTECPLGGNRPLGQWDVRSTGEAVRRPRRRDGRIQSKQSNGMGTTDERYPKKNGRDNLFWTDIQVIIPSAASAVSVLAADLYCSFAGSEAAVVWRV